ncbi:MAG: thiamine-phosphate pyrophosphorylase [Chloroflexota bacterium]
MSRELLRIIDANQNRSAEGLRVLEELARLLLDDAALSQRLKDLRHRLRQVTADLQERLVAARDAAGDVGMDLVTPEQKQPRALAATVAANARRVQESLRVMEELAKTSGIGLDTEAFKHARFELYTLEKDILARLPRQDR